MTALIWDKVDEREYEFGIDRGVLYDSNHTNGVSWNGLTSVDEVRLGASLTELTYDEIKYLDTVATSDFRAVIKAFTMPIEFSPCLGTPEAGPGLFLTRQQKKSFGLSYRSMRSDGGYKVHLVYNAMVAPSSDPNTTIQETVELKQFEWTIDTKPNYTTAYRPTAHFVVDSNRVSENTLRELEGILYGFGTLPIIDGGPPPDLTRIGLDGGAPLDDLSAVLIDGGAPDNSIVGPTPTLPPIETVMALLEEV